MAVRGDNVISFYLLLTDREVSHISSFKSVGSFQECEDYFFFLLLFLNLFSFIVLMK